MQLEDVVQMETVVPLPLYEETPAAPLSRKGQFLFLSAVTLLFLGLYFNKTIIRFFGGDIF